MRDGEAEDVFGGVRLKLARHNLEVSFKRAKEEVFLAAKEVALEGVESAREMDASVRKHYADEPRKMAEWDEIMLRYVFADEEDGGEGRRGG